MSEDEQTPGQEEETSEPTSDPSLMQKSVVEEAREIAERIERANRKTAELLNRQEALAVERTLAGKTQVQQEKPKEESPEEYAQRVMRNDLR